MFNSFIIYIIWSFLYLVCSHFCKPVGGKVPLNLPPEKGITITFLHLQNDLCYYISSNNKQLKCVITGNIAFARISCILPTKRISHIQHRKQIRLFPHIKWQNIFLLCLVFDLQQRSYFQLIFVIYELTKLADVDQRAGEL